MTLHDTPVVTLNGGLDGTFRRDLDVTVLAERVPAATLDRVTSRTIDTSAFDAAVEVGLIDEATVEAVTTTKAVKRSIKVTNPIKR